MNWYNLYKLAFPIIETDSYSSKGNQFDTYYDIGHGIDMHRTQNSKLWFITSDFRLFITDKFSKHSEWPDFFPYLSNRNYLASGRYDGNKKQCSLVPNFDSLMPDRYKEQALKKIERYLDQAFDNPTIKVF